MPVNEEYDISNIDNKLLNNPNLPLREKLTLEDKKLKEIELSKSLKEEFSQIDLYNALIQNNAEIDPDMALRMKNNVMTAADWDKIDIYAADLLSTEENFKIELSQYKNFEEIKNAFSKREKETGYFYGTDILNEPNTYKGASFEDIKKLIDSGATLPEDALNKILYAGNLDLAVALKEAGYNINSSYIDKSNSMTAIEVQIENYAINPFETSVDEQLKNIKKLVEIGVPLKVFDSTRDPLDIALEGAYNHSGKEADALMRLAKNINSLGIPLEFSGYEILEKIRIKNPELYSQYIEYLR